MYVSVVFISDKYNYVLNLVDFVLDSFLQNSLTSDSD